jgi:hypothetical protein
MPLCKFYSFLNVLVQISNKIGFKKEMKNDLFLDVTPHGSCKNDVSEGFIASIIRVTIQEPHGVTSQRTPFFIVTAVKTSNLTYRKKCIP